MNNHNIVLIGMPGCGKSTVGVVLAKIMNFDFLDVDLVIQRAAHARLQTIIDREGNEAFAEREADAVCSLDCEETVIATGGSAALHPRALAAMKDLGPVVYLKHSCGEIISRIPNLDSRGITLAPGQTLADLYAYRTPIYEAAADLIVQADGLTVEQTALEVLRLIEEQDGIR